MAVGVITVTCYEAFGWLQVLITEKRTTESGGSYRLVANEQIRPVDGGVNELADALSQLGVVVWQAADRIAQAAF